MNILITGANGFIGRNTAFFFKNKKNIIYGIGYGKWKNEEQKKWGIDYWYESKVSINSIKKINKDFDLIIHTAGGSSVSKSFSDTSNDFLDTSFSTLQVLEYIRLYNPNCKLIYTSSPAAQGNMQDKMIKEDFISNLSSPYGLNKRICEQMCLFYFENFKIKIGIIRFFSVYGVGLRKQLLWDACNKINNNDFVFNGTGNETRDWINIDDVVRLIKILSNSLLDFKLINCGSGVRIQNKELIKLVFNEMNVNSKPKFNGISRDGDPKYFWADISKAKNMGWEPKIKIAEGIKEFVNYFKSCPK